MDYDAAYDGAYLSYWACNKECDYDYDISVNQDLIGHSYVVPCVH